MNLLKDEVSLLVRKLAVPASVGTLFQTLYTIVDTFYAGKISPEALSALSKSFPIYFLIIATSIGVTVAGTSLIGSSIGEKNEKNVLSYFGNVIIYSIIISIVVSILGFTFGEKIFLLMNSSQEVTILGLEYINVIFLGTILFILVVALNSFLHAEGDTKTYRNVLIFSFFLNIILNPIFIFGFLFIPPLGITGIGIATLIAQFVSLLIVLIKILNNQRINQITLDHFKAKFFFLKNIFFQSMPITIAILGYSIAATIVFTYVGLFGEYAVAGYGSATRIEQVVLLPILGINTAIISIIAQNIGAKYYDRVEQSYFTSIKYGLFIMLIAGVVIFISADIVPKFFSSNPDVIMHGSMYLKISAFILPAYPIFFLSNGFFMALKKSEKAMVNNIARNVIVPVLSFYIAKYLNADFKTFFYIWAIFQWLISLILLIYVKYYIKHKLASI
ncbi:MATE family efflux transporter [Candidatus Pelagibacter sp. FZCC0015]|uniref:MATE family efflux transporter n=1 Tax=Candidatus Pelagibacter sp. FZCC0015 TaxID=2268451 RepID=UPI0011A20D2D|nr:MATE family efflux transporter [Candidatus Pelagibacter sp. FZCC0015]